MRVEDEKRGEGKSDRGAQEPPVERHEAKGEWRKHGAEQAVHGVGDLGGRKGPRVGGLSVMMSGMTA